MVEVLACHYCKTGNECDEIFLKRRKLENFPQFHILSHIFHISYIYTHITIVSPIFPYVVICLWRTWHFCVSKALLIVCVLSIRGVMSWHWFLTPTCLYSLEETLPQWIATRRSIAEYWWQVGRGYYISNDHPLSSKHILQICSDY